MSPTLAHEHKRDRHHNAVEHRMGEQHRNEAEAEEHEAEDKSPIIVSSRAASSTGRSVRDMAERPDERRNDGSDERFLNQLLQESDAEQAETAPLGDGGAPGHAVGKIHGNRQVVRRLGDVRVVAQEPVTFSRTMKMIVCSPSSMNADQVAEPHAAPYIVAISYWPKRGHRRAPSNSTGHPRRPAKNKHGQRP